MTKFKAVINPFKHKVLISARVDGLSCEAVVEYNSLLMFFKDFYMGDKRFELMLHYGHDLEINIYEVLPAEERALMPVSFKLTTLDEF
jgi:hypothetical protein